VPWYLRIIYSPLLPAAFLYLEPESGRSTFSLTPSLQTDIPQNPTVDTTSTIVPAFPLPAPKLSQAARSTALLSSDGVPQLSDHAPIPDVAPFASVSLHSISSIAVPTALSLVKSLPKNLDLRLPSFRGLGIAAPHSELTSRPLLQLGADEAPAFQSLGQPLPDFVALHPSPKTSPDAFAGAQRPPQQYVFTTTPPLDSEVPPLPPPAMSSSEDNVDEAPHHPPVSRESQPEPVQPETEQQWTTDVMPLIGEVVSRRPDWTMLTWCSLSHRPQRGRFSQWPASSHDTFPSSAHSRRL